MKKLLIIIPLLFILIGCTNKEEENKIAYLEYKNELEQRIAALESVTSYLLSKVSELENKVDNLTSRISELENPNRCKLDPEIGAVICDL